MNGNRFKEAKNNLAELRKDCEIFLSSKKSEVEINKFIQEANLEKISYQQLSNIQYLAEGGFEDKNIILKSLNNSQQLTPDFLREMASHKLFADDGKIVKCHGVSQDPQGNYIMVMDYVRGGDLRKYLKNNYPKLDFKKKIIQLHSIAEGLKEIHKKGLIHKDFHSGNILSSGNDVNFFADLKCHITDLGLCRPATSELETSLSNLIKEINNPNSDIYHQCQEAEEYNKTLPEEIRSGFYKLHLGATTHSKLINTKQITQKLAEYASRPVGIEIPSDEENELEKENSLEEVIKEETKLKVKIEKEEDNIQKLQRELNETQSRIQQLKIRLNELEQKKQPSLQSSQE
ncbi:19240_t:CDS:2, partial [Gigaspora margarita]